MTDAQLVTRLARVETPAELRGIIRHLVHDEKLGEPLVAKIAIETMAGRVSRDDLARLLNYIAGRRSDKRRKPLNSPGAYLNKCAQEWFARHPGHTSYNRQTA